MLNLQSIYFGQKHQNFDDKDFDIIKKVARLAHKHIRQCVNDCNGEGWVNGHHYYTGAIDDWAKAQYGQNVESAYINATENTIFQYEIDKIEEKINNLVKSKDGKWHFEVKYQHDPRGNTVKLFYEGDFIEL